MNFKNLSYIKKQNKTILTKKKTKREAKEQKEKKRRKKKTGFGRNRTQDLLHASQIRYYYAT